jgi:hypothetical protein
MSRKAVVCYAVDAFLFLAGLLCALSGFVLMAQGEGGYRGGQNEASLASGFFSLQVGEYP